MAEARVRRPLAISIHCGIAAALLIGAYAFWLPSVDFGKPTLVDVIVGLLPLAILLLSFLAYWFMRWWFLIPAAFTVAIMAISGGTLLGQIVTLAVTFGPMLIISAIYRHRFAWWRRRVPHTVGDTFD